MKKIVLFVIAGIVSLILLIFLLAIFTGPSASDKAMVKKTQDSILNRNL